MDNVTRSRTITDLHARGKEVNLADEDEPFFVWVCKVGRRDQQDIMERANIARAKHMALKGYRSGDSEGRMAIDARAEMSGLVDSRESAFPFLVRMEEIRSTDTHSARIAKEEEWSKDDYLEGLKSAWFETGEPDVGLQALWAKNPDDPDAKRVYQELKRFDEIVQGFVDEDKKSYREHLEGLTLQQVRDKVVDELINNEANIVWSDEASRWRTFYGTRLQSDHSKRQFADISEVDELQEEVWNKLRDAHRELLVSVQEGKD